MKKLIKKSVPRSRKENMNNDFTTEGQEEWEKEFDEKVPRLDREEIKKELSKGSVYDGKTYEFGYKYISGDEIFTVVDWGNIRTFISAQRQRAAEEAMRKERERCLECLGDSEPSFNNDEYEIGWRAFWDGYKFALNEIRDKIKNG